MASSYPSVGLRIDLNDIVQAQAAAKGLKGDFLELGRAAADTGKKISGAFAGRARESAAAADTVKRNAQTASDAEVAAFQRTLKEARATFQTRVAMTKQMFGDETREAQSTLAFRMRLWGQQRQEAERTARDEQRAARETAKIAREVAEGVRRGEAEAQRQIQQTTAFKSRMWTQQRREAEAAAKAEQRAAQDTARILDGIWNDLQKRQQARLDMDMRLWRAHHQAMQRVAAEFAARNVAYGSLSRPELAGYSPSRMPGGLTAGSASEATALNAALSILHGTVGRVAAGLGMLRNVLGAVRSAVFDVRTAVAVFLAGMIVSPIITMADSMKALEARTALYAERASDVPYTFQAIYRTAQDARAPLEAVARLYTRLAPLADRLGKSQSDMLRVTSTVAKSFSIGGATSAEATSSAQQLAQALGANRLGGDELRSLSENAPVLLLKIAQALNMNTGEFIKWAHAGKANAGVIIGAIEQAAGEIDEMFRRMPVTIGQSLTMVGNAFQHFIGEVDKATGASAAISAEIAKIAVMLGSQETINAGAAAVRGLGVALQFLGQAVKTVVDYAPTIGTLITVLMGARILAPLWAAMTRQMLAFSAAAAIAGRGTAAWIVASNAATAAITGLRAALSGVLALVGGPIGAAIIAVALAMNYMATNSMDAEKALGTFDDRMQATGSAVQRGITFLDTYGASSAELTDILLRLNNVNAEQVAGLDEAGRAAFARAEMERTLTVALLQRARADNIAAAASLRRAAGIERFQNWGNTWVGRNFGIGDKRQKSQEQFERQNASVAFKEQLANDLMAADPMLAEAIRAVQTAPIKITQPEDGSGIAQRTSEADKANKEIDRRIEKLQTEIDKSKATEAQIKAEVESRKILAAEMSKFYASGSRDATEYSRLLNNQRDAELRAAQAAEAGRIMAENADEMAADRTGRVSALVAELIKQKNAELAAADAQERLQQSMKANEEFDAQTAQIKAQTDALNKGRAALYEYERSQRILEETARRGTSAGVAEDVDAQTSAEALRVLAEQNLARREALEMAAMTSDEAERHARAVELADLYLRAWPNLGYDFAMALGEATAELERQQDLAANMARTIKDSIREGFIRTGKLDMSSVKEQFTRTFREAVYDALLKKPIDIVVNAVVNVFTKGLEQLLKRIMEATKDETGKSPFDTFGESFKSGMDKMGGQIGDMVKKLPASFQSAMKFAGEAFAGYTAGTQIADMFGFHGSEKDPTGQFIMDGVFTAIGTAIGGPIGGAIGAILSRVIGPAIFGKESNNAAKGSFDATTGAFTFVRTNKTTAETEAMARKAGEAIVGLQGALSGLGINANGVITGFDLGTRDQSYLGVRGESSARRTAVGDVAALVEEAGRAMLQKGVYSSPEMKAFAQQMLAAGKTFEQTVQALERWSQAQKVPDALKTELLKFTDPKAYALKTLQDQQIARRQEIRKFQAEGLFSPAQLAEIEATLQALEREEIADALERLAQAADGAAASLNMIKEEQAKIAEYAKSLLTSAYSPLSPEAQLNLNQSSFRSTLTQAQGGNFGALQSITGIAEDYLSDAQRFYGASEAYADIFAEVQEALTALSTQEFVDPMAEAIAQATAALQAAITSSGAAIVAAINQSTSSTNDQIAQQTEEWLNNPAVQQQLQQWLANGGNLSAGLLGGSLGLYPVMQN